MAAGAKRSRPTTASKPETKKSKPNNYKNHNHLLPQDLILLLTSAVSSTHSFLRRRDIHLLPSQTLYIESLVSSAYSLLPSQPPSIPPPPPCSSSWFDRLLSSSAAAEDPRWTDFFHISKRSFSYLHTILSPFLINSLPKIPPKTALAATLFRLSHGACYKSVARYFNLGSSSVACRVFYTVCKVVNDQFGDLLDFGSDISRIAVGFGWISLPNCCGVLGFGKFNVDLEILGSNGSVLVQALVDSECRFLDISAGWPCTLKPESIFFQSKLYSRVEESREVLNGSRYEFGNGDSIPQYILGNSCFPPFPWLLTPYIRTNEEDSFSSAEKKFNSAHNRAMGLVGDAFGRVKSRWQLLSKKWKGECVEFLPYVIVTGCLLHNFLINRGEPFMDDNLERLKEEEFPTFAGERDENGGRTRDVLVHYLGQVSYL